MRSDWKTEPLSNILECIIDYRGKTPRKTNKGIPLVTAKIVKDGFIQEYTEFIDESDYDSWMTRGFPEVGDVVLTTEAPLGEVAQIRDRKVALAQRIVTLRGKNNELNNDYLKYFLISEIGQKRLRERETGTTVVGIKQSQLLLVEVDYPDYILQVGIASILKSLDDKIELNCKTNETLEQIAQALFKSWFIDFDPVKAKAEGLKPVGMDDATAALFPDSFVESELGMIPEGWEVKSLPAVIDINPRRVVHAGSNAPYLDMKNMPTSGHTADEVIFREFTSGTKFQNGDTLIARITPCLENGKTAFVDFLNDGQVGWGSTEYIVFSPKKPLPPQFGYYLARSESLRTYAIQNMTGSSGRQRVPSECFDKYSIVVPEERVATQFGVLTNSILKKIKQNSIQSKVLESIRDSFLPKLLSGEMEI